MSISSLYPSIRPSLLLDFANTKQLDPRITFSRPTTATYYDGKTTAVAEQNLLTYSQEFDNAAWTKYLSTVTSNSVAAPDGTTTADTLTADGTSGRHGVYRACPSATTSTLSFYAKAGTGNFIQILTNNYVTDGYVNFDLSSGTLNASTMSGSIVSVGSGWYRCSITGSFTGASFIWLQIVSSLTAVGAESNTLTDTVYIWGAQLEQRSAVSSYTPTTSAAITNYIPVMQTALANVPRFDCNPTTGESLGLLIEEQRTNLLTYSADFSNGNWVKANSSISADTVVAPDGTLTGDKYIEAATSGVHQLYQTPSLSATAHSFSVYAKKAERSWIKLNLTGVGCYFDLNNGVLGTADSGATASIQNVGNGWYKCSIIVTTSAGTNYPEIQTATANGTSSYAGDGYSGIYIWGAQLEAGSFATSYIPTVASQVTRSADSASMTGSNFSSWFNQAEGTLYCDSYLASFNSSPTLFALRNSAGEKLYLQSPAVSQLNFYDYVSGTFQVNIAQTSLTLSGKYATAYKANDFAFVANAGSAGTDTSALIPASITNFYIGSDVFTSPMNGTIKRIAYYPKRLSNTELQAITS